MEMVLCYLDMAEALSVVSEWCAEYDEAAAEEDQCDV